MHFEITHTTAYSYTHPAAEAYGEVRLTPLTIPGQHVWQHELIIDPSTKVSEYRDHFGNIAHFFSLPYRHQSLKIVNRALVETTPREWPTQSMEQTVQETRQIFSSVLPDVFEYLQPTELVGTGGDAVQWARKYLPAHRPLGAALKDITDAIHTSFKYRQGATDASTPLVEVWAKREGVCQDFAHVALSVLRTAGIPARYVCGYIETEPPRTKDGRRRLIGAVATHAWVDVLAPGMVWVGIDPTNKQFVNDQYVAVSFGRDARDASPIRGTFKGSGGQTLKVSVLMKRRKGGMPAK